MALLEAECEAVGSWPSDAANPTYWRSIAARDSEGLIGSRQMWAIEQLCSLGEVHPAYLAGIIRKATGRDAGLRDLTASEGAAVIDALRQAIWRLRATEPKGETHE